MSVRLESPSAGATVARYLSLISGELTSRNDGSGHTLLMFSEALGGVDYWGVDVLHMRSSRDVR